MSQEIRTLRHREPSRRYAWFALFSLFSILAYNGEPRNLWHLTFLCFLLFLGYLRKEPTPGVEAVSAASPETMP